MTNYFNPQTITILSLLVGISVIPTLIYIAYKVPEDNGEGFSIFGYYVVKLLRILR